MEIRHLGPQYLFLNSVTFKSGCVVKKLAFLVGLSLILIVATQERGVAQNDRRVIQ
jgi:hypothetical protein